MQIIKINPMNYFPAVIWGMLFSVSLLILIYNLDFQVNLEFEKSGDDLQMHFPITIATVPFRIPNSNQQPNIHYGNVRNKDLNFSMWNGMSQIYRESFSLWLLWVHNWTALRTSYFMWSRLYKEERILCSVDRVSRYNPCK